MKKIKLNIAKISLLLILIILIPSVIARGSLEVSPSVVPQNSFITITIDPTSYGMYSGGLIYEFDHDYKWWFAFDCGESRCYTPQTTHIFIDDTWLGDYYASLDDYYPPRQFLHILTSQSPPHPPAPMK